MRTFAEVKESVTDFFDPVITTLIAVMVGIIILVVVLCNAIDNRDNHDLYNAWTKASAVTNLTYQEWNILYQKGILPGQKVHDSTTTAVPIYIPMGK